MALFQHTILNKYIKALPEAEVRKAYEKYVGYYHNPEIQENIRNSKEEQYQQGFLEKLFGDILGYTPNPKPGYNLICEKKSQTDATKADGAILVNGEVFAVIELKDMNTPNLADVENQVFGYYSKHPKAQYAITSNFEKLRLYIGNRIEYQEFNLFTMSEEEFREFYLCLAWKYFKTGLPKQIKEESLSEETNITKIFYKQYSEFKRELFNDIVARNPQFDQLLLFKKTQKLLDRLIFMFFAEDCFLIPPNTVRKLVDGWNKIKELDVAQPLYQRLLQYFGYFNTGVKNNFTEIYAYNGGLFEPDEIIDNLTISDEVLEKYLVPLSDNNFQSDVDVNILGHIFEHSLSEIEEKTAELTQTSVTVSKRKKDGVFYTPKYITSYIVEQTLGKFCAAKKEELGIAGELEIPEQLKNAFTSKSHKTARVSKKLISEQKLNPKQKLAAQIAAPYETYRQWLLKLTICDPACGSGAFLNQALEYLIAEHRFIDEAVARIYNTSPDIPDIENTILENNLFGVDINDEAVEIAKLSLWLRTARPGRKLNNLNNNIKCGNSLISNPAVAGDKAFDWEKEFPEVFAQGGFDVVIGNPPYGIFIDEDMQEYYSKCFPLTQYKINLFVLFIERMLQIFKKTTVHFIIPKSLLFNTYYEMIRRELIIKTELREILTITERVFEDAEVGSSLLLLFDIVPNPNVQNQVRLVTAETIQDFTETKNLIVNVLPQGYFLDVPNCEISVISSSHQTIRDKVSQFPPLSDCYTIRNGLNPGNIKHVLISPNKKSEKHKPIIWGKEISRYSIDWQGDYVNYDPTIHNSLTLEDTKSKRGMREQEKIDYALRTPDLFETRKIVIRKTGDSLIACLDENHYYFDTLVHGIYRINEACCLESLLAVLNSKPATFFYRLLHDIKGKVFPKVSCDNLASFPVPDLSNTPELAKCATEQLHLTSELLQCSSRFLHRLQSSFEKIKINTKLKKFLDYSPHEFFKELSKQKIKLSLKQQDEWEDYFTDYKNRCLALQEKINQLDKTIDRMVYALYDLTNEEIAMVESGR